MEGGAKAVDFLQKDGHCPGEKWKLFFFWKGRWGGMPLEEQFPQAFSFAKNKNISVLSPFREQEITELFFLPLSQIAYDQVLNIQQGMQSAVITEDSNDVWTYFGGAIRFRPAVAYRKLLGH